MGKHGNKLVVTFLILVIVGVLATVRREAAHNPTFDPGAYATLEDCLRNIPEEWSEGSLDHTRAEAGCRYVQTSSKPTQP